VLKEKVIVLGAPPYGGSLNYENDDKGPSFLLSPKPKPVVEEGDDGKEEIGDIAGMVASYTVRDIVVTVARHFMSVRSFVEYGAKALRLATSCYSMMQSMTQLSTISMLMAKGHSNLAVVAAAIALKKNTVTYIDLLAFWPHDDITVIYYVYWQVVDIIQGVKIKSLNQIKYSVKIINELNKLVEYLDKLINRQCNNIMISQDEFFREILGIDQMPLLIIDPYLDLLVQFRDLKRFSFEHITHVDRYVKKLKINTMPTRMWSSVFLVKGSLEETRSDLSEITEEVEKELSKEHPKTAETISGHSVDSRATEPSPEGSGSA